MIRLLTVLLLTFGLMTAPAQAQDDVATVRLDGRAAFQVGPTEENQNPSDRARRIEARLNGLLRNVDALAPPVARETPGG